MTTLTITPEQDAEFKKLLIAVENSKTVRTANLRIDKALDFARENFKVGFPTYEALKARAFASHQTALEKMIK